jgi:hypothetical protein
MKNPLAGHPLWRQLLIVSIVLPIVLTLAILAFAWPAARIRPRDVPIGVVGSAAATRQLVGELSAAQPGAFDVRQYEDRGSAESAIRDRDVYWAFVLAPGQLLVLTASAAGPAVAQLLDGAGATLAQQGGGALATTDVVPLSAKDAKGLTFSSALLPLTICSLIVASAVGLVVRFRPAWRQLVALTVVSAAAGLGIYLVTQSWLGALPHDGLADWASLSLTILALSATTAGLIALIGAPGLGLAAIGFVFVGNAFSGVTSAPQLLPGAVEHLGQWLPPGAGASLLRSAAYFDGRAAGGHVGVLVVWALAGCAAIIVGHHAPIRFAAARMNDVAASVATSTPAHAIS